MNFKHLKSSFLFVFLIGSLMYSFESFAEKNDGLVEVEPQNLIPTVRDGEDREMISYKERRTDWGGHFGLQYSTYEPREYGTDVIQDFDTIYEGSDVPLIEMSFGFKRNISWGSLSGDMSLGYYKAEAVEVLVSDTTLTLIPLRLGFSFILDNIWREPIIAPYISGGIYIMKYEEKNNTLDITVDGTTFPAPYAKVGLLIQLDWAEKLTARVAYQESGVENTFLFIEGGMLFASSEDKDPDFSNTHATAGLRLEF